ncbi:MAG: hypothetical protein AAGH87_03085 [Pseudomonadota bacterium]
MSVRQLVGLGLLALGAYLGWGTLEAFLAYTSRGASLSEAGRDPVFLVPGIRSLLAIGGGLLAVFRAPGAAICTGLAGVMTALLTALLAVSGASPALWADDAIAAALLLAGTCALVLRQRTA